MGRNYYATRISENRGRTPEGYLMCNNVPICRTGWQTYLGAELGLADAESVQVYRSEEEVFAPETLASFEAQPVTNNHPSADVGGANYAHLMKGVCVNVRRGEGDDADKVLADLKIMDPTLISEIETGKNEVSCGYDCVYVQQPDGTFLQTKIRGNHVAIVREGRAGHDVKIKDQKPQKEGRKTMRLRKAWEEFVSAAHDAEPEEAKELTAACDEEQTKEDRFHEAMGEGEHQEKEKIEEKYGEKDEAWVDKDVFGMLKEILARLDRLEEHGRKADPLDELEIELKGDAEKSDESNFVEPAKDLEARNEVIDTIAKMKPIVAKLPVSSRDQMSKMLAAMLRNQLKTKDTGKSYGDLVKNRDTRAVGDSDKIQAGYNKFNPHMKEVK